MAAISPPERGAAWLLTGRLPYRRLPVPPASRPESRRTATPRTTRAVHAIRTLARNGTRLPRT
eukprot:8843114-Lingulodinium_polyedra.AAC.1